MMIRPQMDWRRLMNHFALRYMCLLRKYGEAPQPDTTTCFIIDDTVLEKSGVRMEGISRVTPTPCGYNLRQRQRYGQNPCNG